MMPSHPSVPRRRALGAAFVLAALAGLAGCGRKGTIADLKPPPAPPPQEQAPKPAQ